MKSLNSILFMSLAVLAFMGCKKDDPPATDTSAPQITVTSPANDTEILSGNTLTITGNVSDNVEVNEIKIEIHPSDDGHTHEKAGATAYEEIRIIAAKSNNFTLNEDFEIPADAAAGKYHILVFAVDKSGNEAPFVERDIIVKSSIDSIPPSLSLTTTPSPNMENEIEISEANNILQLNILVADNDEVEDLIIEIENETTGQIIWEKEIHVHSTNKSIQESVTFLPAWAKGHYHLHIKAIDATNNITEAEAEIHYE